MLADEDKRENPGPAQKREGAVMLVVMLVLMVATASAAVSVHTSASEMHAAGQERTALQVGYVAETAMMTTIVWSDIAGDSWNDAWSSQAIPLMFQYAEPSINPTFRHAAMRANEPMEMNKRPVYETYPVTQAAASGSGGSGGSGGSPGLTDLTGIGSFGPKQALGLARDINGPIGYIVDFTDCYTVPSTSPGNQIGGGNSQVGYVQYNCTLTAHARVQLPVTTPLSRAWTVEGNAYNQDRFMGSRDSRATIITGPILAPKTP